MKEIGNKKKHEFTEEETQDIINKYKSGLSCNKISQDYPCSSKTIERYLRKNGVVSKDNPSNINLTDLPEDDIQWIINSYINGMSCEKIGKKYNCNEGSIKNVLKKNNISYSDAKHFKLKEFSHDEIEIIIEKYKSGISVTELEKEYNCNYKTINKLIPEDIKIRFKTFTKINYKNYRDFTIEEKEEIKDKYLQGVFQKELGVQYNCPKSTIVKILNELGINGKDNPLWDKEVKKFSIEIKENIIKLYKSGTIQDDLAKQFNCSRDYIGEILSESGYSYKDNPNYSFGQYEEMIIHTDDIINLYNEGLSITEIASKYIVGKMAINNILTNNNIEIRKMSDNYSEEELLQFLREIYDDYGFVNTELLNDQSNYPTSQTYLHRFGSFKNAMKKAELPYSTSIFMLGDEICKSGYEYRFSLMMKKFEFTYDRDYLYSNLITNYKRKHSLDYVIYYKGNKIYLEIFGMSGSNFNDGKYDKIKYYKLDLCKTNEIKLLSLYPDDFKLDNDEFEKSIIDKFEEYINKIKEVK